MKFLFFFIFFSLSIFGADFISPKEYQESLYKNPRGISCAKCHGNGEEQILGYYTYKGKKTAFVVPNIKNLDYNYFKSYLNKTQETKSIMPTYSLTEEEILSLYKYITNKTKESQ